jgi:hypothetical protein
VTRIFISYARADCRFVQELRATLVESGHEVWLDVDEIRPGDDWLAAIESAVEAVSSVVFVVSPDALRSDYCLHELRYAAEHGKQIVAVVVRGEVDGRQLPPEVEASEWVDARDWGCGGAVGRRLARLL